MKPRIGAALVALGLFAFFCGCGGQERPVQPAAVPPPRMPLGQPVVCIGGEGCVSVGRIVAPRFELRGPDFEDARGRGCPLEAVVDEPDAGEAPVLRFRCAVYGGP